MHTTETERAKYEKMWSKPSYRRRSPGLDAAPQVFDLLGMKQMETLIDYGCGEAKATDWFRGQGLTVHPLDLVPLRPDVIEACLWDLPDLPITDYAFCADVMEHIPPEHVDAVLAGIRERTRIAGAFQIASIECAVGRRHGETLHLTVQPRSWWQNKLEEHWSAVEHHPTDKKWRHLFLVWP